MRESFFERFGSWLAIGLATLFAWRLISTGLHESEAFSLFFPLHWVALTPAASFMDGLLAPFRTASWWLWVEVAITVAAWMLLYVVARMAFYTAASMEGLSMWVAFTLCIALAATFFFIVLRPAFDQMAIWKAAWPATPSFPS